MGAQDLHFWSVQLVHTPLDPFRDAFWEDFENFFGTILGSFWNDFEASRRHPRKSRIWNDFETILERFRNLSKCAFAWEGCVIFEFRFLKIRSIFIPLQIGFGTIFGKILELAWHDFGFIRISLRPQEGIKNKTDSGTKGVPGGLGCPAH